MHSAWLNCEWAHVRCMHVSKYTGQEQSSIWVKFKIINFHWEQEVEKVPEMQVLGRWWLCKRVQSSSFTPRGQYIMTKIFKKLSNNLNCINAGAANQRASGRIGSDWEAGKVGVEGAAPSTASSQAPVLLHGRAVESFCLLFFCYKLSALIGMWVLPLWLGWVPGWGTRWYWQKDGLINTVGRFSFGTGFDLHVNYKLS